jgi:hypothetical protein
MHIRKAHYISGVTITVFVGLHFFNHCFSMLGAEKHIEVMATLRHFYRNIFVETVLLLAVATQVYSGLQLFNTRRLIVKTFFERLQIWTGLYLAMFLVIHMSAVLAGRFILALDTNFYFGAAGINSFPFNLFFIPYYFLAVVSFFGHISAVHNHRIKKQFSGLIPLRRPP